ncbi:MAG: hypothetical protein Q4G16_05940 [Cruoricaptor ignavus]|nr:hypothetical protein [Cruoricaptor ignavus]
METNNENIQNHNVENTTKETIIIIKDKKSVGLSLLLTFFFGPLGMLYSTVTGAIVMFFISAAIGFITLGFGFFLTWPICMIWGAIAASNHNSKIISRRQD